MEPEIVVAIIASTGAIILSVVNMVLSTVLNNKKIRKKQLDEQTCEIFKRIKVLELASQAILRDRLYSEYNRLIDRGYATYDEKENFENMYKNYHSLGSNGVMDHIRDEVTELPTKQHSRVRKTKNENEDMDNEYK
nr:MAG TPA: holin protein [Caudoviricetes sp.]